ncbi:hypothetical protein RFI_27204, partial [Reticulomyxa filosa]
KNTEILNEIEANFDRLMMSDGNAAEDLEGIDPLTDMVITELKQHQRVGLQWLTIREKHLVLFHWRAASQVQKQKKANPDPFLDDQYDNAEENLTDMDNDNEKDKYESLPPFYREEEDEDTGDTYYVNILNGDKCDELPSFGMGGILADDMGLGKTLQILALICNNSGFDSNPMCGYGPTLIVTPLSVMSNWVQQIREHIRPDTIRIYEYYGSHRNSDVEFLKQHHVVLTTYNVVLKDYSDETDENREQMRKYCGAGLQYVDWLRVVLDEAHKIRSRKTRIFKACSALVARSRWCISGTPVQNRLDDLYSLFNFLRLHPISDMNFWSKFIISPLKHNQMEGLDRLRTIMRQVHF